MMGNGISVFGLYWAPGDESRAGVGVYAHLVEPQRTPSAPRRARGAQYGRVGG